ncbi:MAG: GntR family transcriptional regulator [Pseudomonadota bacterium]
MVYQFKGKHLSDAFDQSGEFNGALPIYLQIAEMIAREIGAGRLLDGERLPPERDMAREHNVSVGTLRKSLAQLEGRGLLERRQGSGNYIRHQHHAGNIYALFRLELVAGGGLPTAKTLVLDKLPKPKDAPDFGPSQQAYRFQRLRYLDGIPAALEEIWLDGNAAETLKLSDVSESLYHFYKTKLGRWITRAEDRIGIAPVPDWQVDQFGLKPGDPAGFITRIAWDQHGERIEFSRTWFDPKMARYVSRLK